MGSNGAAGELTFLFTDVEGSTRLWEAAPASMRDDLARHDDLLTTTVRRHDGDIFKFLGDGIAAVFEDPAAGVAAAVEAQRALGTARWQAGQLRVRMGLHTGAAQRRDGDWFGPTVNRTARLQAVAHGGQIVLSGPTADLVTGKLPEGIDLVDLGEHRLRDLVEPERIHQVVGPDLASSFSPLRTEHHPSRGVPAPSGRLLGRAVERRRLQELVSAHRMVTITGPPGGGKTRLAVELARDERERWPGGIWFCSLASLPPGASGAGGVAGRLADLLGSVAADGASALEVVVGALTDRRALVVLDGCDHVIEDAAVVAEALRDGCPGAAVLVTSRERLDVPDEHLLDLPTLDDDAAVHLFVERATVVRSQFDAVQHADAVRSLIGHLDGLPLAIELAAARVRTHSPADIDRLLGEQARILRTPNRRGRAHEPGRHHDLEMAIAWSYDLLDPLEQRIFRHLGVFAGPFTPDDVIGLLPDVDPTDTTDVLDTLVERSLVVPAPPRPTDRTTRDRLLRTLRSYARRRLEEHADEHVVCCRWAACLAARLEATTSRLTGPDEARWVREIADVWEDVRAQHQRACATGNVALAVRLVAPLVHHSTMRGLEVGEWADRTVTLPGFWDLPSAPRVASMAAEARMRRNDPEGATALALEAIARAGDGAGASEAWLAHSTASLTAYVVGDFALGATRQQQLHAVATPLEATEPIAPAVAAYVAATVMTYAGLFALAEPAVDVLDQLAQTTGCPSIEALARLSEGRLLATTDPAAARRRLLAALDLATTVDNVAVAAQARWILAELASADDPAGAVDVLRTLLTELRQAGDEGQQQQVLLAILGPVVTLELDLVALLVAGALEGTVWSQSAVYRAALPRLEQRADRADWAEARDRAACLGLCGTVDEVVRMIDELQAA